MTDHPSDDYKSKNHAKPAPRLTATAIQNELKNSDLPKILASGRGKWAEKILNLAFENGVKVREDAELAEMLAAVELDSEIPTEAIAAVAEILAYVYQAEGRKLPQTDAKHDKKE